MNTHIPQFLYQHFINKTNSREKTSKNEIIRSPRTRLTEKFKRDEIATLKAVRVETEQSEKNYQPKYIKKLPLENRIQCPEKIYPHQTKDISFDVQKILKSKNQVQFQKRLKTLEDVISPKGQPLKEQFALSTGQKKTAQSRKNSQQHLNEEKLDAQQLTKQKVTKSKPIYYTNKTKKLPRCSEDVYRVKDELKQTSDQDFTEQLSDAQKTSKLTSRVEQKKENSTYSEERRKTDLLMVYSSPCDTRKPKSITKVNKETGRIDQFIILKKLGSGNFGSVLLVVQAATGCIYAMKVISKAYLKAQQHIQIKIQLFLKNCYVVKLYHVFDDPQNIYMLMQAMQGSLYQKMQKRKTLTQQRAATKLYQLIKAVRYLHEERIIHRDIKLENILEFQRAVKLGDFGCSIHTRDLRKTKIGSFAYHSPEQLDEKYYDEKVDIWSLGIVTYELLFGGTPFDRDIYEIIQYGSKRQLADLKFPSFPKISSEAKDFILKLLRKNPLERMSLQQALQHPFIKNNVHPYWQNP